jgi:hypothetical protein
VISIGHNDNGPFDSGRARAVLPGTACDSLDVIIKETGAYETVYTYGGYLRRYIAECRAAGAHPILMSLTPRDAVDEATGKTVRKPQTQWAALVAAEEGVPFVDLNEISGAKLDSYSGGRRNTCSLATISIPATGVRAQRPFGSRGHHGQPQPRPAALQRMMVGVDLPVWPGSGSRASP